MARTNTPQESNLQIQLGAELTRNISILQQAFERESIAADESARRHNTLCARLYAELELARDRLATFGRRSCHHTNLVPSRTPAGHLGSVCTLCGRFFEISEDNRILRDITNLPRTPF